MYDSNCSLPLSVNLKGPVSAVPCRHETSTYHKDILAFIDYCTFVDKAYHPNTQVLSIYLVCCFHCFGCSFMGWDRARLGDTKSCRMFYFPEESLC